MQREVEIALIERALALIDAKSTERGEPSKSPVERYLDPARFQREIDVLFRRYPLALCPSAKLAQVGDSFALDVAGLPLVMVRADDGRIHAFVNACRHRGARVQPAGSSHQRALVCPYHSWTYALDGTLRGRPHDADFSHAPAAECALARVPAAEALGFVWVVPRVLAPDEDARLEMEAWLGGFGAELRSSGLDGWVPFHQRDFSKQANWKILFEGNLETYHFQYAHRDSIAHLFYDNLLIADHDRQHHRLFLPKRSIESLLNLPKQEWKSAPHANIIYYFFPATFFLYEGDHANVITVLPEARDRSHVFGTTLIPEPPKTEKSTNYWRKNVESFWGALDEDFALAASVQSTMTSGVNRALHFGANEQCSTKFHADVEAAIG
jgi:phenylpropionate dioxygenase-like ring-hydroxylating dioxygenase large terminal subunit